MHCYDHRMATHARLPTNMVASTIRRGDLLFARELSNDCRIRCRIPRHEIRLNAEPTYTRYMLQDLLDQLMSHINEHNAMMVVVWSPTDDAIMLVAWYCSCRLHLLCKVHLMFMSCVYTQCLMISRICVTSTVPRQAASCSCSWRPTQGTAARDFWPDSRPVEYT